MSQSFADSGIPSQKLGRLISDVDLRGPMFN
jgi:hypothetical protein